MQNFNTLLSGFWKIANNSEIANIIKLHLTKHLEGFKWDNINAEFIPNSNSLDEPLVSLNSLKCLPADFSTPAFRKINWNGIFKSFLLDEWLEQKPFSCAFLCVCYLAQPGGLKVKIMSGGDEGMWAGNNISLWNNPSVAVLSQRPLFMEILQMWSPLSVLREANHAGGHSS